MDITSVIAPMLADPTASDREALRIAQEPSRWVEQKVDGVRLLLHVEDGEVAAVNRKGIVIPAPSKVAECFRWMTGRWVFDGELVKGEFHVFDLPRAMDSISVLHPYHLRRAVLEDLWSRLEMDGPVHLLPSYSDPVEKLEAIARLRDAKVEGVMLKDSNAPYCSGLRSRSVLKWKFYETVDVVVMETWREGKRSMGVGLFDDQGVLTNTGSVTMTPANLARVTEGDVVEVKYLYVDDINEPRLYQPAFIRRRDDKSPEECTMDQLKITCKDVVA